MARPRRPKKPKKPDRPERPNRRSHPGDEAEESEAPQEAQPPERGEASERLGERGAEFEGFGQLPEECGGHVASRLRAGQVGGRFACSPYYDDGAGRFRLGIAGSAARIRSAGRSATARYAPEYPVSRRHRRARWPPGRWRGRGWLVGVSA